jgi:hypothetical protein
VKTAGLAARKRKLVVGLFLFATGAAGLVSSCGGGQQVGSRPDAGDADDDVASDAQSSDGGLDSGTACQSAVDASEPEVPANVTFDGGVPLDQVAHAIAVVRCNYWSRCFPIAPYVVAQCIEALGQTGAWNLNSCTMAGQGNDLCVGVAVSFSFPSVALLQAAATGLVRYDPNQESACLQALSVQGCHSYFPWENIAACAGVFTCAAGAGDAGPDAGGAADGGEGCSGLFLGAAPGETMLPCSTAGDCTVPGDPYCVDGYCAPEPCGNESASSGCPSVDVGQPCNADPPFLGTIISAPSATVPKICLPGLSCTGVTNDGGLGVCAAPQDIGGSCTQTSPITGCRLGLICQCGTCQLPPSGGPCGSGCEVGVSYCDRKSDTCMPVKQIGDDCVPGGTPLCAPDLLCDSDSDTCQPYSG